MAKEYIEVRVFDQDSVQGVSIGESISLERTPVSQLFSSDITSFLNKHYDLENSEVNLLLELEFTFDEAAIDYPTTDEDRDLFCNVIGMKILSEEQHKLKESGIIWEDDEDLPL